MRPKLKYKPLAKIAGLKAKVMEGCFVAGPADFGREDCCKDRWHRGRDQLMLDVHGAQVSQLVEMDFEGLPASELWRWREGQTVHRLAKVGLALRIVSESEPGAFGS